MSIIEYFKKNVEDDLKRPAVCEPHHAASCEEAILLKLADQLLNIKWKHCDVLKGQMRMN